MGRLESSQGSGTTPPMSMLESEFMRLALGAGAVVGVLAPAVGFFLVQRRQSLTGDGIGHVAFAGVAAGIVLDVAPVLTALVFAVLNLLILVQPGTTATVPTTRPSSSSTQNAPRASRYVALMRVRSAS